MRGMSRHDGSDGGVVDMILRIAPICCAFFAFLFMAIATASGITPGTLEGINIINFNMSRLGQDLIPDVSDAAKDACAKAGDVVDNTVHTVTDTVQDIGKTVTGIFGRDPASAGDALEGACNKGAETVDDAVNRFLGSVAKAIGIKEYYSVHIGVLCEGQYDKTFNTEGAKPAVENCTQKFYTGQTDISKKLDEEMRVGPFKFKLSDIKLVQEIQDGFDKIPEIIAAMAFFFLFAVLALVAGFLCAAAVPIFEYREHPGLKKFALFAAMGSLGVGWFATLVGAAVTTGVAEGIKKAVNEHGDKFGLSANTSPALWFLLWGAVVFATAALVLLVFGWLRARNRDGLKQYNTEKNASTASSMPNSNGFAQMPTRGGGPNDFQDQPLN